MYLIFDTETTGLPKRWDAPITDTDNWPRCIQIAWQLHDEMGQLIEHQDYMVKPDGFNIPYDAERIHGISTELATEQGIELAEVLEKFNIALSKSKFIVGQNVGFDVNIMGSEFYRMGIESHMASMKVLDTCTEVTADLLKYREDEEEDLNCLHLQNFINIYLESLLQKHTMLLPTLKQLHVVFLNW